MIKETLENTVTNGKISGRRGRQREMSKMVYIETSLIDLIQNNKYRGVRGAMDAYVIWHYE